MLVLFIAWGFRCQAEEDDSGVRAAEQVPAGRSPLLREQTDQVVAAASPPTPRGSNYATSDSTEGPADDEPVSPRLCCVCLERRIQVVVIPCGHACMCRKCSFRLSKCPVCRLDIQAQHRFYM